MRKHHALSLVQNLDLLVWFSSVHPGFSLASTKFRSLSSVSLVINLDLLASEHQEHPSSKRTEDQPDDEELIATKILSVLSHRVTVSFQSFRSEPEPPSSCDEGYLLVMLLLMPALVPIGRLLILEN